MILVSPTMLLEKEIVSFTKTLCGLHAIMATIFIVETVRGSARILDCGVEYSQLVHVSIKYTQIIAALYMSFCIFLVCTDIENCADIRCTTDADHYCFECESNHGVALGESAYRNLNTSCEGTHSACI